MHEFFLGASKVHHAWFKAEGPNPKRQGHKALRLLALCFAFLEVGNCGLKHTGARLRRGSWMSGTNHAGVETFDIFQISCFQAKRL